MRVRLKVVIVCLLYLSSLQYSTMSNVDQDADLDDVSYILIEDDKIIKAVDKLPKELEDENELDAYEGDDILTDERLNLTTSGDSIEKRKIEVRKLWPHGIVPWEFSSSSPFENSSSESIVEEAIDHWETNTCLKFFNIRKIGELNYHHLKKYLKHDNYLSFNNNKNWCSSYIGYQEMKAQPIYLIEPNCVRKIGTTVHEIGHAIGFTHEQSRSDRDDYVTVNYDNIYVNKFHNFDIEPTRNLAPYDLASMMHYGPKGFSIDNTTNTITPKEENLEFLMRRKNALSSYDIIAANAAYDCTAKCGQRTNNVCQNGGYIFKDCSCRCPKGLTGTYCEEIERSWAADGCSEIITLDENGETEIKYLNHNGSYNPAKCFWLIKAPKEYHLQANITIIFLPMNRTEIECYHWLDVKFNLMLQHGLRICGKNGTYDIPRSKENMMIVMFNGSDVNHTGRGFKISIAVEAGSEIQPINCQHGEKIIDPLGYEHCACQDGYKGGLCDAVLDPVKCYFTDNMCVFKNDISNDIDWRMGAARIPEEIVHGTRSQYLFVPTQNALPGNVSTITSAEIERGTRCVTFSYHLFSTRVGQLTVSFIQENSTTELRYDLQTSANNSWSDEAITVISEENFLVKVEALFNGDDVYDIALKNLTIVRNGCKAYHTAAACIDSKQVYKRGEIIFSCDFSENDCGFVTSKESPVPWQRELYLYASFSSLVKEDDNVAEMTSPLINVCGQVCLEFSYAARGNVTGDLEVFVKSGNKSTRVIKLQQISETRVWTSVRETLPEMTSLQLMYSVKLAAGDSNGHIAVNDVEIKAGPCLSKP